MHQLRTIRMNKGISQSELSRRSGISRVTINNIENGKQDDMKVETIKRIAGALEVDVSIFFENGV